MNLNRFLFSLVMVFIYDLLMVILQPTGLSLLKVMITSLAWGSFLFAASSLITGYLFLKRDLPPPGFYLYLVLLTWNLMSILKSFLYDRESITTLFGNPYTTLAMLVPFSLSFISVPGSLKTSNRIIRLILILSLPCWVLYIAASRGGFDLQHENTFQLVFFVNIFLVTFLPFQPRFTKILILVTSAILLFLAFQTETRTMIIRVTLAYSSLILLIAFRGFSSKWVLAMAFSTIFIPFILLATSIIKQESAVEKILGLSDSQKWNIDTRTFLYREVFEDLKINDEFTFGKGSNGRYQSPYFEDSGGDTKNRLSVEAGILAILLKSGIIGVVLNMLLFIYAIYLSFFHSNNTFATAAGLLLLIHFLILFFENPVNYSFYNILIWFYTGICMSEKIRNKNDEEVTSLLHFAR